MITRYVGNVNVKVHRCRRSPSYIYRPLTRKWRKFLEILAGRPEKAKKVCCLANLPSDKGEYPRFGHLSEPPRRHRSASLVLSGDRRGLRRRCNLTSQQSCRLQGKNNGTSASSREIEARDLPGGVYFCRSQSGDCVQTRKLVQFLPESHRLFVFSST